MNIRFTTHLASGSRCGTSTLDALTAFTLIVTVISVVTPLAVRHGRLLKSQHQYRLALDELSNQMEKLTALSTEELPQAAQQLKPSDFITARLPGAQIKAELQPAESSTRLSLSITWRDAERDKAPLTLAAWVFPKTESNAAGQGGEP
jgi:hypothetical protein